MKRLNGLQMVLNSLITAALSIFFIYSMIQIGIHIASPFELGHNYTELRVTNTYPANSDEDKSVLEEIRHIIQKQNIELIVENIDSLGLGIYDPKGFFANYAMKSGNYLSSEDFLKDKHYILVKDNSYVLQSAVKNKGIYNINQQEYKVIGVYDSEFPLHTDKTEYVYNFFDFSDVRGTYYINTTNVDVIEEVSALLTKNNYSVEVRSSGSEGSAGDVIKQLISNSMYMTTVIGLMFIYGNYYLFNRVFLLKYSNMFEIHLRFGATRFKLLIRNLKELFLSFLIGTLMGTIVYLIFYRFGKLEFSLLSMALIILMNLFLSFTTYILAFCSQKIRATNGDFL